jgi:hypothetical protein
MNRAELAKTSAPIYRGDGLREDVFVCGACGTFVDGDATEQHSAWHRELVEWILALSDLKADAR